MLIQIVPIFKSLRVLHLEASRARRVLHTLRHGVYVGMVVGENSRENDLNINVYENKKLINVRSAGADDALNLTPPRKLSLENALEYIGDDELVEITPKSIRLRKKVLNPRMRK